MTKEHVRMVVWRVALLAIVALGALQLYAYLAPAPKPLAKPAPISLLNEARAQGSGARIDPKQGALIEDIWKPAPTPPGGTSWSILEGAKEVTRTDEDGFLISYPIFTKDLRELDGKRITVAGWMDPLQVGDKQKRFVLLGYPPGCPFHFHAAPMQFIEVLASTPFETDRTNVITVSGVLELTGYDEGGVFFRLWDSRPA